MTKDFNYHLTGTGWAEVFFSSDTHNIRFEISYLSDPLSELFEGLCRLINNQSDTEKIIFAEEPGEHSLIISKQDNGIIKVEIFWCDNWDELDKIYDKQSKKELVYTDTDTLKNFTNVLCGGMDSFLQRQTLEEYKEKWCLFEFPLNNYNNLKKSLS